MPTRTFTRAELDQIGAPYRLRPELVAHHEVIEEGKWIRWCELVLRAPDDRRYWLLPYEEGLGSHEEQGPVDPWRGRDSVTATEVSPTHMVVWKTVD